MARAGSLGTAAILLATAGAIFLAARPAAGEPGTWSADVVGWWRFVGPQDGPAPVLGDGALLTADREGALVALEPTTGTTTWRATLPGAVSALGVPATGDGVAVATDAGTLAWYMPGGAEAWRTDLAIGATPFAVQGDDLVGAQALAVDGDDVAVVAGSAVVMVDRVSGSERWRKDLGGSILGRPLLLADRAVVGSGERVVGIGAGTGTIDWAVELASPVSAGLVEVGGLVVAMDWDGDIVGLDPATGAERWRGRLPDGVLLDAAVLDDAIIVVDMVGSMSLVDATTGSSRWTRGASDGWTAFGRPAAADGAVWVVDEAGMLHVLDAADGSERWTYGVGLGGRAPVVADGLIHVQTLDGPLVTVGSLVDPRRPARPPDVAMPGMAPEAAPMAGAGPDGTGWRPGPGAPDTPGERWRIDLGAQVSGGVVSDGDLVAGGGLGSVLYGLDAATGERRWRFATADWIMQTPAMTADVVLVGDESAHLYGVDRVAGTGLWEASLDASPGAPIVTDGARAYVFTRAQTLSVHDAATGELAWTLADASSPAVADGIAYVVTATGVRALDATTGAVRWEQPGDFPSRIRPSVSGGRLYVPVDGGVLVLDARTGLPEPLVLPGGITGATIGDGVAVLAWAGTVSGLDLATGFTRWISPSLSTEFVHITPVLADDAVYLATGDGSGDLVVVDALHGTERWRFDTRVDGIVSAPAVVGEAVFVSAGTTVLALSDEPAPSTAATSHPPPPTSGPSATLAPTDGPRTVAMAGGDAGRSGREPGPAPVGQVQERWRVAVPGSILAGTARTDTLVAVVTDEGWLLAMDPLTGQELWRAAVAADGVATPLVDGDFVYVADGGLAAHDARTGAERWRMDGVATGDPLVASGLVLVSGREALVAVDIGGARGLEAWRFAPDALADGFTVLSRPALADGMAFVVAPATHGGPGTLWALDAGTGEVRWQRDDLQAVTAPAVVDGFVAVGTRADRLAWLDAVTGATVTEVDTGSRPTSPPSTDGETWYVGTDDGELIAADPAGDIRWRFGTDDVIAAQPTVAGDAVVVASYDGFVYAVDRDSGAERWRFETGREMDGAPSIADGVVIVAAGPEVIAIEGER